MAKRKQREESDVDTTQPLGYQDVLEIIGTENDPCFGKLHDTTATDCQRCGDNELCRIVQAQLNAVKREKLEEDGQRFMDTEVDAIKPQLDADRVESFILGKLGNRGSKVRYSSILRAVWDEFDPNELLTKEEVRDVIKGLIKKPKARLKILKVRDRTHITRK